MSESIDYQNRLLHIGTILTRCRESRGLNKSEIAFLGGNSISTITRLESKGAGNNRKQRHQSLERFIEGLDMSRRPLTENQKQFLRELYGFSYSEHVAEAQRLLDGINFEDISPANRKIQFGPLVAKLEQIDRPALILDPLWFIHAINGAAFRLFGIDPRMDFLNHWEAWHSIATKFHKDSPARAAHYNPNVYFQATVEQFFWDKTLQPFLFTAQMQRLLERLHRLSKHYGFEFTSWWDGAISFTLNSMLDDSNRIIMYQGQKLLLKSSPPDYVEVELDSGFPVTFAIVVFEPDSPETVKVYQTLRAESQKIYYAYNYDRHHDFHVNCWPTKDSYLN